MFRPGNGVVAQNLAQVRVHADGAAARSAKAIHADAYAAGSHVVFAQGKFSPRTRDGRKLLAHELVHVLQQRDAGNVPSMNSVLQRQEGGSGSDSDDDDDDQKSGADQRKGPLEPDDPNPTGFKVVVKKGKRNFCFTYGGLDFCEDTIGKIRDLFKKKTRVDLPDPSKCPTGVNMLTGKCCPPGTRWDSTTWNCVPFTLPPPPKCLPGETPNSLFGDCCKPGEIRLGCLPPGPVFKFPPAQGGPPPTSKGGQGNQGGATPPPANHPPSNVILHFQLDHPKVETPRTEQTLLNSLVAADKPVWSNLVNNMQTNPSWRFQLVGRASPEGTTEYNEALGQRRALLVKAALGARKIADSRIVDVAPECSPVQAGIFNCGESGSTGPDDRQVKVVFEQPSRAQP